RTCIFVPSLAEIQPGWVELLDEPNLLDPRPTLQLLFTINRLVHVVKVFKIDEPIDSVSASETVAHVPFVLPDSLVQIAGDTDIEVQRAAGEDIDHVVFAIAKAQNAGPSTV